jgi:hypothetical protein
MIIMKKERKLILITHRQYIESTFEVLAKTAKSIYFIACGEECCEINNTEFDCHSVEEFYELVEMFENEDLSV